MKIESEIRKISERFSKYSNIECYIFGSALTKKSPSDIDLMFIHNLNKSIYEQFKKDVRAIRDQFDITVLSKHEAYQENLISNFPRLKRVI